MKYSKITKFENKDFRYNYENNTLEYIGIIDNPNKLEVLDCIGLSVENWESEEREQYLFEYNYNLDMTTDYLMKEYKDEFC